MKILGWVLIVLPILLFILARALSVMPLNQTGVGILISLMNNGAVLALLAIVSITGGFLLLRKG